MAADRILFAAPASGSGKTLITCGFLRALQMQGKKAVSFKCGPDYIDPMFHSRILGTGCRNLDTFFASDETVRYLLSAHLAGSDFAVLEGVMGYYDGIAGTTDRASAYDVARATDTPVILIVNAKGTSISLVPMIRGFLEYRQENAANSRICGILFNRMSPMLYPRMKELAERELPVPVLGYVPERKECAFESRHLGLVLPEEIEDLQKKINCLAECLLKTLDWEQIYKIAGNAPDWEQPKEQRKLECLGPTGQSGSSRSPGPTGRQSQRERSECVRRLNPMESLGCVDESDSQKSTVGTSRRNYQTWPECQGGVRIGVASDEAFCFFYEDNFKLLEELGAELVWFSPIHDPVLPENLDGLLLFGGYPELHAKELSENTSMRSSVKKQIARGLPCMAECGGFLYLHEQMEDMEGKSWPMTGVIGGSARKTDRLGRFGYITLRGGTVFGEDVGEIPSHEFHYFDSDCCGDAFLAEKPESARSWRCIHSTLTLFAGFPHLYYYANPKVAQAFVRACRNFRRMKTENKNFPGSSTERQILSGVF